MSEWKTDTKRRCFIDECPSSKEASAVKINISQDTWNIMVALTRQVKTEWQAFLTGTEISDATGVIVEIDGYWIPKQKVTAATVENVDIVDANVVREKRIVASIHSHSEMSVFHSSTDIESTCQSAWVKHHITINNKLEYVAKSQHALACGKIALIKAEVSIAGHQDQPVIEGLSNIEKPTAAIGFSTRGIATERDYDRDDYWHRRYDDEYVPGNFRDSELPGNNGHNGKKFERGTVRVSPLHRFNQHNKQAEGQGLDGV